MINAKCALFGGSSAPALDLSAFASGEIPKVEAGELVPSGITSPGAGRLNLAAGAVTVGNPILDLTANWTGGGVHRGIDLDVLDTSSANESTLMRLRLGGVNRMSLSKLGELELRGSNAVSISIVGADRAGRMGTSAYGNGFSAESEFGIFGSAPRMHFGGNSNYNGQIYGVDAQVLGLSNFGNTDGISLQFLPVASTPDAPSSGMRTYCDTSGGKHRMMVRFPTGAVQQIAIEP